jgi:TrbC/VIRB2 pilin
MKNFISLLILCCMPIYAGTTGNLPFNSTIQNFQDNFYAWIAIASIMIWIATCLLLAFGEWGDGMKKLLNILFWLSLALSGATAVPTIFGTGAVF